MIYFVQTDDNRYIKVGYAADVRKRLDGLRTSSPHALKLLASMPGDVPLERQIHQRFDYLRANREWFHTAPELVRLAASGSRLGGITSDTDPFLAYAILEPRLIDLLVEAASARPDDDGTFCANYTFFQYHNPRAGLKWRLSRLVGHHAEGMVHPKLTTSDAYDAVYERIYDALPNCNGCGCPSIGALMGR